MESQQFGASFRRLGKLVLQRLGDAGMQLLTTRAKQTRVGGILNKCMLENVRGLRRLAANIDELGADEARKRRRQLSVAIAETASIIS